jgi:zinc finger HIT domain-containing protein 3
MTRYPMLKAQLQIAYAHTLDPGPNDKFSWHRQPLLGSLYPDPAHTHHRGRGRGRGGRGGRSQRGARGSWGGRAELNDPSEERQRGPWTQEKGDKESLLAIKKMKMGDERDEKAEGMREFVELCQIKFGPGREGERQEVNHGDG